jgi:ligand-binding sensor domain-containing protein
LPQAYLWRLAFTFLNVALPIPKTLVRSCLRALLTIRKLALISGLLLAATPTLQARAPHYLIANQEAPVALLTAGKVTYLVTEHTIFQLAGRQFVQRYKSATPISCALATDSVLWLGTQQGLLRVGTRGWQARLLPLPDATAGPTPITALFCDAVGTVWVGATGYGAYQLHGNELQNQLHIPTVSAGLATADSSVWIATSIGLYRWQHQAWMRYNEEGVANHEIPDNIVEHLLLDNAGSLWVLMSQGISVFENLNQREGGDSHLPTVTYIGRPGNQVYSVAYLPGQGHVFATGMGLLLLPPQPKGKLAHFEATTDKVETPQVLVPVAVPGRASSPHLLQVDARQRVWAVSRGEVSVWRAKDFQKATLPAAAKPSA